MELENNKIKINKSMRKAELYDNCIKLLEVNHELTGMIKYLEKQLQSNMVDSLSLTRSIYFILHNFEPRNHLIECDIEDGDIEIKKEKPELGMEIQ